MTRTVFAVSSGSYSDYSVHVIAATEAEAQAWADAYNEARGSLYREPAEVEEMTVYQAGDPLPRKAEFHGVTEDGTPWMSSYILTDPADHPGPEILRSRIGVRAVRYPTAESAMTAWKDAQ